MLARWDSLTPIRFRWGPTTAAGPYLVVECRRRERILCSSLSVNWSSAEVVVFVRLNGWNTLEYIEHLRGTAAGGPAPDIRIGLGYRYPLGKYRGDKGLHGNTLLFGKELNPAADRIGNGNGQSAHDCGRMRKNSAAVMTEMPNSATPAKSLTLWVTMCVAPAARAHSKTRSSSGSGRNGRHRK